MCSTFLAGSAMWRLVQRYLCTRSSTAHTWAEAPFLPLTVISGTHCRLGFCRFLRMRWCGMTQEREDLRLGWRTLCQTPTQGIHHHSFGWGERQKSNDLCTLHIWQVQEEGFEPRSVCVGSPFHPDTCPSPRGWATAVTSWRHSLGQKAIWSRISTISSLQITSTWNCWLKTGHPVQLEF